MPLEQKLKADHNIVLATNLDQLVESRGKR